MPTLPIDGAEIYYEETGSGPETIVFSHGLLFDGRMFDAQVRHFRDRYRCIVYDHRGQGRSSVPAGRIVDMDQVYRDAVTLIEALDAAPCHFVGLSMGGFVGLRIAARKPKLLRSLTLLGTSADSEPDENRPKYRKLNFIARWFGLGVIVDRVMPIMFGQTFLKDGKRAAEREECRRRLLGVKRSIHKAVNGVIERKGVFEEIDRTATPTLVLVGEEDVATVPIKSERLHRQIARSMLVRVPHCGHSSSLETPGAVIHAMEQLFAEIHRQDEIAARAKGENG